MENNYLLYTKTVDTSEILGNGKKYIVPLYQRDYAWKEDNWEDLWNDILLVLETNSVHYMGVIVLQSLGQSRYAIIDGQQRLTTLTLFALSCIQILKELAAQELEKEANEERIRILSSKFLGEKEAASLTYTSKLTLNKTNNLFFQLNLLTLKRPAPSVVLKLNDSDKLLLNCLDFFYKKITLHFQTNLSGEKIAWLLDEIVARKVIFTQISVENELQAYLVFETLNSRGSVLSSVDLLKNYLFSLVPQEATQQIISEKWNYIVDWVGVENFPLFLRRYWISKNKLVRPEHLYKHIKAKIKTVDNLFDLLEDLEKNAVYYVALHQASDELWRGNREIQKRIGEIGLFQAQAGLPLLLIAYEKMLPFFDKILKLITTIAFRYTVMGGYPEGRLEEVYHKAAIKVAAGEITNLIQLAKEIEILYISDTDFKNSFSAKSFNTRRHKKLIRYILFELENKIASQDYDFEAHNATIEHILPENPQNDWEANFPNHTKNNYVFRIGNYTLLEANKNREVGNKDYTEKLTAYQTSQFFLTKQITYPDWNPHNLEKRQLELAKIATTVWRVSYYDK
ncbi:DUF262 domain-containing protein [Hugenholtzia roseola]|uniref:DUF262 domain-containing protein n=1 Tax=Hugenholtzia roseola TaxID=1002 RepID=UPI000427C012|nr:DUF262 domain-containing protein [Hugenholtzia roseola]